MTRLIALETRVSIAGQIVTGVRARIRDSDVRPGAGLPSIRQLAAGHGIRRLTLPVTQRRRRLS
ncbi:GntR family transcriptional regulator [Ralstonia solanacearum]|uniref:GntR family transcriptional regulator n=1 Tax=Ralstonia solanacearum TaxID=305 RepID=A0AAE3NMP1_RALSL|nr:GntR family transcriptional regulator [Ralstonia solanacearum]MDB0524760.1 GntR family transcriptional regulator [Ralstonia solanacearum]